MLNITQLRMSAREIFDEMLRGLDAADAIRQAVRLEGARISFCDAATIEIGKDRNIYSIAIGKAALALAAGLDAVLGSRITAGVVSGSTPPREATRQDAGQPQARRPALLSSRWQVFQGGHPEPNDQSLAAAQASFGLLKRANEERALIIFLVSGGGSAMIEWPLEESITLADLRRANKTLVNCGASISEINAVRRAFSAVKGGRLAARAPDCTQITLIVSDVLAEEERAVASGPSLAPPGNAPKALEIVAGYNLRPQLPESILRALEAESKTISAPIESGRHFVLLDNHGALEAAAAVARRRGMATEIATDISDQPIAEGCAQLLQRLESLRQRTRTQDANQTDIVCLISGGEFACPVRGEGLGGRNLETALQLVSANSPHLAEAFVAICAGTDGIDGNSPAAGAIVDHTTIARASTMGIEPADFLERSDSYSFFVALGDTIATGATGTNVRDIRILLASVD